MRKFQNLILLACLSGLIGCVPGYNSVLFATRSNAGLDVDGTPPTTEVTIAREEFVIAPTYEGGQTHPVAASFSSDQNFVSKFLFGVGSTFSTGEAAFVMATLYDDPGEDITYTEDCTAPFKPQLTAKPVLPRNLKYVEPGTVKPVIFTTDTMLGLKVGWGAPTGTTPSSVKVGFNRKEIAFTPIAIQGCNQNPVSHSVNIPSLLATVDTSTDLAGDAGRNLTYLQYFATGVAATELSKKFGVRRAMLSRLDPGNVAAFDARVQEIDNLNGRVAIAEAAGSGAVKDVTTDQQAAQAHAILSELNHAPGDCPALSGDLNNKKKALANCAIAPTQGSEAEVAKFEAVILKLRNAIPYP